MRSCNLWRQVNFLTGKRFSMKHKILSIIFLMMATVSQAHEGHSKVESTTEETKTYIDPTNIQFNNKQIYVRLNQDWVQTNAVFSDATGLYIVSNKGGWTCGYCAYYNTTNLWVCDNCGRPR